MKKFILASVSFCLILMVLSSCSKIKEKRLQGSWVLNDWYISSDSGRVHFLTQFHDLLPYDEIHVDFLKDNLMTVETFKHGEYVSTQKGIWAESSNFQKLAFPDSVFLFDADKIYTVDKLTKESLILKGQYTLAGTTYDKVTWEFSN